MTVLLSRLDSRISVGATLAITIPGHTRTYNAAGQLSQNLLSSRPVHTFDISHGVRSAADFQVLVDSYYVVLFGGYEGLLFRDWRDYIATQRNSSCAVIDSTHLQLQRLHVFGGQTFARNIFNPCTSPAAIVYRTRSGVTSSITSSVDQATGIATISAPHVAGDTYTWLGQFDLPVAFTDDKWTAGYEVNIANLFLSCDPIQLEEII